MATEAKEFPRRFTGYDVADVRSAMAGLERHCEESLRVLADQARALEHMVRSAAHTLQSVKRAVGAESGPEARPGSGTEGPAEVNAEALPSPPPPPEPVLRRVRFGYDTDLVASFLAERRAFWEGEWRTKLDAVLRLQSEHERLLQAVAVAVQSIPAGNGAPAERQPPAAAASLVASSGSSARAAPVRRWRPGAVEEGEQACGPAPSSAGRAPGAIAIAVQRPSESVAAPEVVPSPVPPAPAALTALDQVQQGLAGRLEVLYDRFLVGKALGADLVLPDGRVLGARGALITRELARAAEEAGVLPSLIVTMVIPGLPVE